MSQLDFEKPVLELEQRIRELRQSVERGGTQTQNMQSEITRMENKSRRLLEQTYAKLTPAQKVLVARHPERPHGHDFIKGLITDFTPLAGDRLYSEDNALIAGLGRLNGRSVAILAQEKGADTEGRIHHNFGMARPEGYRKAQRILGLAERFGLPVLSFIDTAGAYPGMGAEERGQSQAIAATIEKCMTVKTPIIATVIGEGGSGGAIAIAAADRVFMLEHSIYSVISPEGCASILWRSAEYAKDAAAALRLTAQDLERFGIVDGIIGEMAGGAHRNKDKVIAETGATLEKNMKELEVLDGETLVKRRRQKYLEMGSGLAA